MSLRVSVSRGGCLSLILFIFLMWALIFGVTINGKHYGIECTSTDGVKVSL